MTNAKTLYATKAYTHTQYKTLGILLMSALMGCAPQDSKNTSSQQAASSESPVNTTNLSLQKVFIEEAQIEDIKSAKIECGSSSHGDSSKICVKICHVPPGNPQNKSEKVLPLSAIKAHLNHGSNHAEARDYLGACQQVASGDSTSSSEVPTDGSSDNNPTASSDDPAVDTTNDASNDSSTNTGGSDPTQDTSSSTAETTAATDTSVVPLWCQPFVAIDTNCDGLVDSSGDPYL